MIVLLRIFFWLLVIAALTSLFLLVLAMGGVIGDPLVWQR